MMVLVTVVLAIVLVAKGLLLVALIRRRNGIIRSDGVFRCKARVVEGSANGRLPKRWPRFACYGVWAHDVLILYKGPALTDVVALVCRYAHAAVTGYPIKVPGMGPAPRVLLLELDDKTMVEIAAARSERERLAGPYVTALFGSPWAKDRLQ